MPAASSVRTISAPNVDPAASSVMAVPVTPRVVRLSVPVSVDAAASSMAPVAVRETLPSVSANARSRAAFSNTEMSPATTEMPSPLIVRKLSAPKLEPVWSRVIAAPVTP